MKDDNIELDFGGQKFESLREFAARVLPKKSLTEMELEWFEAAKVIKTEKSGYGHLFSKPFDPDFNPIEHMLLLKKNPLKETILDSEVQINNIVDEVEGNMPREAKLESMLRNCFYALDSLPRQDIAGGEYRDTYALASAIEKLLKEE